MALVYNNTTIPENGGNIIYNGTSVDKVIYNGTTVWTKQTAPTSHYIIQNGNVLKTITPLSDTWTMQMSVSGNTFEIYDTDAEEARGSFYVLSEFLPAGFSRLYLKFKVYTECTNGSNMLVKLGMITDATYNTQYAGSSSHPGWINNPFDGRELATQQITVNDRSTSQEYTISINAQNLPSNTYHAFFGACNNNYDVERIRIIVTDLYLQ